MADEATPPPDDASDMLAARRVLMEEIEREVAWTGIGDGTRALDPRVREAMGRVPRECFVPPHLRPHAHDNRPLPIGHGQTISQPLIVAVMTHLLRLEPSSRVLEIGTGSGYQTAILAELAGEVVSVEVVAAAGRRGEGQARGSGLSQHRVPDRRRRRRLGRAGALRRHPGDRGHADDPAGACSTSSGPAAAW